MPEKKGITLDQLIEAWLRNSGCNRATGRELGCHHTNITKRIRSAYEAGDERIDPKMLFGERIPRSHTMEEINRAALELGLRSERKVSKGDWRKPSLVQVADRHGPGPIMLGVMGDPHLDNSGADLQMWEEEISRADPDRRIFTCCVGDFFDNWPRAMGHLYAESGDPTPAWVMFEYWMENWPFLFSVTGNHDQFSSGTANFLEVFMRERKSLLRRSGGRFMLDLGGNNPITVSMRHIWQGNSQYSEAHNLKRAATFGHTDDDVIIGGHFHKGELRTHVRPLDGKVSKLVAVSSFKRLDNYANDRGFMSAETPPYVWLVCDDREPVTSHNRVQSFYDFPTARAVFEHQKAKNAA